jgi:hypothetical protein
MQQFYFDSILLHFYIEKIDTLNPHSGLRFIKYFKCDNKSRYISIDLVSYTNIQKLKE